MSRSDKHTRRLALHQPADEIGLGATYDSSMGILEYLLAGLGPEARKKLAAEAAKATVKQVGDSLYEKADEVREKVESAAEERREKRRREEEAEAKRRASARAEQEIEDELAALKARLGDD